MSFGIFTPTLGVLEEEKVMSERIFKTLKKEHFERLLPRMSIGQHALVMNVWESMTTNGEDVRLMIDYMFILPLCYFHTYSILIDLYEMTMLRLNQVCQFTHFSVPVSGTINYNNL